MRTIAEVKWFDRLEEDEQQVVLKETNAMMRLMAQETESRVKIGAHLSVVKPILEARRLWLRYLREFGFSQRTAYRYLTGYEQAAKSVSPAVLKVAAEQAVELIGSGKQPLGIYTEAVRKVGPPPEDEAQIKTWLSKVVNTRKQMASVNVATPFDRDSLQRALAGYFERAFKRLPINSRVRGAFVREHCGIVLAIAGMSAQMIQPMVLGEGKVDRIRAHAHSSAQPTNGHDREAAA